jgi:hypothetical protein
MKIELIKDPQRKRLVLKHLRMEHGVSRMELYLFSLFVFLSFVTL